MENMEKLIVEFEDALLQINRVKAGEIFERCYVGEKRFDFLEGLV